MAYSYFGAFNSTGVCIAYILLVITADELTGNVAPDEPCGVGSDRLMLCIALGGTVVDPEMLAAGDRDRTGEGDLFREFLVFLPFAMLENSCNSNNLYCKTE